MIAPTPKYKHGRSSSGIGAELGAGLTNNDSVAHIESFKKPQNSARQAFNHKSSTPSNINDIFALGRPGTSGSGIDGNYDDSFKAGGWAGQSM